MLRLHPKLKVWLMTYPRSPCRFIRILSGEPGSQNFFLLMNTLLSKIKFFASTSTAVKDILHGELRERAR